LYPYWASSGYGERPLRAFIVLAALVAAAGLTLAALGFKEIPGSDRGVGFVQLLDPFSLDKVWAVVANFFKYITFQRDFFLAPATMFGEFIKAVAQVLIPIQVALFVFALRNKFRR
jgi:hypothetical protein